MSNHSYSALAVGRRMAGRYYAELSAVLQPVANVAVGGRKTVLQHLSRWACVLTNNLKLILRLGRALIGSHDQIGQR